MCVGVIVVRDGLTKVEWKVGVGGKNKVLDR